MEATAVVVVPGRPQQGERRRCVSYASYPRWLRLVVLTLKGTNESEFETKEEEKRERRTLLTRQIDPRLTMNLSPGVVMQQHS